MKFELLGTEYPAEYTVAGEQLLCEKFGSIEKVQEMLSNGEIADRTKELPDVVALLVRAGIMREKKKAEFLGAEYNGPEPIEAEAIALLSYPGQLIALVRDAMKEGYSTTIKLEKAKEKNGEATRSA